MKNTNLIITYGFALFAMFFGSGNLVFPIKIGLYTNEYWYAGFVGLFLTGIILPFLGLFVVKLHRGSYASFFAEAGTLAKFILPLFALSLLGSFGVVPRCITVAHGGLSYFFEGINLIPFSLIFCSVTYILCLQDKGMVTIMGKFLSPFLFSSIIILILIGIFSPSFETKSNLDIKLAFYEGFLTGYETMDLLAAFFFSAVIFSKLESLLVKEGDKNSEKDLLSVSIFSSIIGGVLLSIVYMGFVYLGAKNAALLEGQDPEFMLAIIAKNTLGRGASIITILAIVLSCLTTAVALNSIYAHYMSELFHVKERKFYIVLLITTGISCLISMFDFKGIASFLAPVLVVSYPSLIVLTIMSIFIKKMNILKTIIFYAIALVMFLFQAGFIGG